jgi:hypothetical protein
VASLILLTEATMTVIEEPPKSRALAKPDLA